jgi:predicted membrane protein
MNKEIIKISSNKSFGLVFFTVFVILGLYPLINDNEINFWLIIVALIFLILALFNSKFLTPLNIIWNKFGLILGSTLNPIILGIIYFIVVTPIALILRLAGKDVLSLKIKNRKTSWNVRINKKTKMKNQF